MTSAVDDSSRDDDGDAIASLPYDWEYRTYSTNTQTLRNNRETGLNGRLRCSGAALRQTHSNDAVVACRTCSEPIDINNLRKYVGEAAITIENIENDNNQGL